MGAGDAADRVRLSRAVCATVGLTGAPVEPQLSGLADAVAAGAVGQRQAARLAATFDKFPSTISQDLRDSVERFLVVQTQQLPPVVFGRVARQIELMADPDGPPEERDAHEKMEFRFGHRRDNGLTPCYGLLDDLTTEALRTAFGAICAPAATRNRETHPTDPANPTRPADPARPADRQTPPTRRSAPERRPPQQSTPTTRPHRRERPTSPPRNPPPAIPPTTPPAPATTPAPPARNPPVRTRNPPAKGATPATHRRCGDPAGSLTTGRRWAPSPPTTHPH